MGLFSKKHLISGLAASLLIASGAFAEDALFDNHSDKTNQNEFEYYWYYYDDNGGIKDDDRPIAGAGTQASVVDVDFVEKERNFEGNKDDKHIVKEYTFTTGEEDGNVFATMPFTFGEQWLASWCSANACASPFVGIGSMLCAEGETYDLTGATGIKFKVRAKNSDLTVRFKVETMEIIEDSTFGYFQTTVVAPAGAWETFTINFDDLAQPSWADEVSGGLNLKLAAKLAWEVSWEDNTVDEGGSDCLDLDDIEILNHKFVSPFMWIQEDDPIEKGRMIGDFDSKTPNQLKLPYDGKEGGIIQYWYAYDDGEIEGTSEVTAGATKNEETNRLDIAFKDGNGFDGSEGAYLEFSIGEPIPQDTIMIMGFVGVGCNLYDSLSGKYYDAKADGATGVTFSYLADGDMKKVTVELSDYHDVSDGKDNTTAEERGSGVVMFRDLPVTTDWSTVTIPFDEFMFHSDWESAKDIPLDITKLAKFQVKVQGGEGVQGFLAVDNVRFTNAGPNPVRFTRNNAAKSAFNAAYANGKININYNNISNGKISIVNTRGSIVKSIPVSTKGFTAISTDKISAGMYIVKLDAKALNGKSIVRQAKLNIVK